MKVLTVVGARPQFIKAAVVSHKLRRKHTEILVHTGQHFDYNMSEQFFEELNIPKPNYNLGISGGTHAQMTGRMMISLEEIFCEEEPDWILVYGDTNSTLAASIAAAKLHIPICHVEAGTRTHSMTNPEEINRICTDHVSTLLLASTRSGVEEMKREGLETKAHLVGDPMLDAFMIYSNAKKICDIRLKTLGGLDIEVPNEYYYLTCHREENTKKDKYLLEILDGMEQLEVPVVYPVHPRNNERVERLKEERKYKNILFVEPVGYLESTSLVKNAKKIVTDSGGLQREAFFSEKKCVTILDFVVWPETMVDGRNVLSSPVADEIINKLAEPQIINTAYKPFGDGNSSEKIVKLLEEKLTARKESEE